MNYRTIARELLSEHPQTIAVALARLPAEHSSEIIKLLPGFIQTDLISRIVNVEQLPSEVVEEIDALLDSLCRRL